jgi:hypothetical protein
MYILYYTTYTLYIHIYTYTHIHYVLYIYTILTPLTIYATHYTHYTLYIHIYRIASHSVTSKYPGCKLSDSRYVTYILIYCFIQHTAYSITY